MAKKEPVQLITTDDAKRWLRRFLVRQRQAIPESTRQKWSRQAVRRLIASSYYKRAKVIAAYLGFGSEVNTDTLIQHAWKSGKTVVVPMTTNGFHRPYFAVFKKGERLRKTAFGPFELVNKMKPFPFGSIDLVVLPGLGFDATNMRLGFGGGVYDRILRKTPRADHVGLFFSNQYLPALPHAPHDRKMDAIVTEKRQYSQRWPS